MADIREDELDTSAVDAKEDRESQIAAIRESISNRAERDGHDRSGSLDLIDSRLLQAASLLSPGATPTSGTKKGRDSKKSSPGNSASSSRRATFQAGSRTGYRASFRPSFIPNTGDLYVEPTIILDIGTRYSKVGFVGEPAPRKIIRTKFRLGDKRLSRPFNYQTFVPGSEVPANSLTSSPLPLSPHTWEQMAETLVHDLVYNELKVKANNRKVLILEDSNWPIPFKRAIVRTLFRLGTPRLQFLDQLHSSVFCTGSNTALVLNVGYSVTRVQATLFGHVLPESRAVYPIGMQSLVENFKLCMEKMTKGALNFEKYGIDDEQVENAVARTCFIPPSVFPEDLKPCSVPYEFKTKTQTAFCKITPSIRKAVGNALFDNVEECDPAEIVLNALMKVPVDARAHLAYNVLLTGGTCEMVGFEARFMEEWHQHLEGIQYENLRGLRERIRFLRPAFRKNTRTFAGASVFGKIMDKSDEIYLNKDDYNNNPTVIPDWTDRESFTVISQETIQEKLPIYNPNGRRPMSTRKPAGHRAFLGRSVAFSRSGTGRSDATIGDLRSDTNRSDISAPDSTRQFRAPQVTFRIGDDDDDGKETERGGMTPSSLSAIREESKRVLEERRDSLTDRIASRSTRRVDFAAGLLSRSTTERTEDTDGPKTPPRIDTDTSSINRETSLSRSSSAYAESPRQLLRDMGTTHSEVSDVDPKDVSRPSANASTMESVAEQPSVPGHRSRGSQENIELPEE